MARRPFDGSPRRLEAHAVPPRRRARPRLGRRARGRRGRRRAPRVPDLRQPRRDAGDQPPRARATCSRRRSRRAPSASSTRPRWPPTASIRDNPDVLTEEIPHAGDARLLLLRAEGGAGGAARGDHGWARHRRVRVPSLHRRRARRAHPDRGLHGTEGARPPRALAVARAGRAAAGRHRCCQTAGFRFSWCTTTTSRTRFGRRSWGGGAPAPTTSRATTRSR